MIDRKSRGAALAVCSDEWQYSQRLVSGRSFTRQASDDLIKVFSISLNPPAQRGMYDLLSKEVSLSDLKWTYHRTRAIPDHICRKFPVNLSELRPI